MDPEPARSTQTNKRKSKKRFSDEQIKLLESMFSSESRPEPQAKHQIAHQLGLHPRQVAIWFQNRRAKCKLKQIEHDYRTLKGNYDNLSTRFESLKDEHHYLISEVKRLKSSEDGVQEANKVSFTTNSLGEFKMLSGSPLSSGNDYGLESVLEPNYLAEDKYCSEWWESY